MRKPSEETVGRILGYSAPVLFVGAMVWGFAVHSLMQSGQKDPLKMAAEEAAQASVILGGAGDDPATGPYTQPEDIFWTNQGGAGAAGAAETPAGPAQAAGGADGWGLTAGHAGERESAGKSNENREPDGTRLKERGEAAGQNPRVELPGAAVEQWEEEALPVQQSLSPTVQAAGAEKSAGAEADIEVGTDSTVAGIFGGEGDVDDPTAAAPALQAGPGLVRPVMPGEVLRKYGLSYSTFYQDYRFHGGIDLAAAPEQEVVLAAAGRIEEISLVSQGNYRVVVDHGDAWTTVYSRLDQVFVAAGEKLEQGQALGRIGLPAPEEGAGTHLHFELWYLGRQMDPAGYLG